jgi:hypothetical protein
MRQNDRACYSQAVVDEITKAISDAREAAKVSVRWIEQQKMCDQQRLHTGYGHCMPTHGGHMFLWDSKDGCAKVPLSCIDD